ncbi:hypothetical protein Hypma_007900 [Hypsizygus marmoreus]|uniref:DASH complex subunit DUO1 n=1 Tax=Hypsizygus marmoreus TaxID=39966 RepID=A0A369JYZ1_HYPMA|nr:hypothetical protein Hypma_007900 [Hypsizygus marmoreus]
MYSPDSSAMDFTASGSRLLSESPMLPSSSSHTGPGGDDLSISELSLSDRPFTLEKSFTLLAHPRPTTPVRNDPTDNEDVPDDDDEEYDDPEHAEQEKRRVAKVREEKLQSDVFILRKLNASFALFNEALQDTGSANQRIAAQLAQTDALLNKYIGILSKSEEFTRLIFDEQWQGADADEETIERERIAEMERARRETEERALAAQREVERRQREEQERIEQEERERLEREKKERAAARGGVRGVRGTRASMRGMRGLTRTAPPGNTTRGRPTSTMGAQTTTSKLPTPTGGGRSSATGPPVRGLYRRA